MNKLSNCL